MVARQFRVLEAWSSNLHTSTKKKKRALVVLFFFFGWCFDSTPFAQSANGVRILHAEVSSLLVNRKCKYLRIANTSTQRALVVHFSFWSMWLIQTSLCEAEWSSFFKRSRRKACFSAASAEILLPNAVPPHFDQKEKC